MSAERKTGDRADEAQLNQQALQDATVINEDDLVFGLPAKYFYGGLTLTFGLGVAFKSVWYLFCPAFGFVYFTAMYSIHKEDSRGAEGWKRALQRPSRWSGGRFKGRRVRVLRERE